MTKRINHNIMLNERTTVDNAVGTYGSGGVYNTIMVIVPSLKVHAYQQHAVKQLQESQDIGQGRNYTSS